MQTLQTEPAWSSITEWVWTRCNHVYYIQKYPLWAVRSINNWLPFRLTSISIFLLPLGEPVLGAKRDWKCICIVVLCKCILCLRIYTSCNSIFWLGSFCTIPLQTTWKSTKCCFRHINFSGNEGFSPVAVPSRTFLGALSSSSHLVTLV